MQYEPVVAELVDLIALHHWEEAFQDAVDQAHQSGVVEMKALKTTGDYLNFINNLLRWVPSENTQGKDILKQLNTFHYILGQAPLSRLQNEILPAPTAPTPTPLSAWMLRYASAIGAFLDTPESVTSDSLASFRASPAYNMDDYLEPRGGWRTFNELFARNFKPGYRPVAAITDPTVIVSAADSTFAGQWEIRSNSHITVKDLHWMVSELMEGSPYRSRFVNGQFMHAFLSPVDYHRQHAPVGGTVVEARVIPGQVYLQTVAVAGSSGVGQEGGHLEVCRVIDALDGTGYQFAQSRGLIVLSTPIGLVAVLPIGMSHVSSVVITAEVGATLRKGEELSYFQFGGSDIVVLFESSSNVSFTAQPGTHYKMGARIAQAFPVG